LVRFPVGRRANTIRAARCNPFCYQRTVFLFWRSIDINTPRHSITVICAEPPKLISGSGTPTTGARPITIAMLMET